MTTYISVSNSDTVGLNITPPQFAANYVITPGSVTSKTCTKIPTCSSSFSGSVSCDKFYSSDYAVIYTNTYSGLRPINNIAVSQAEFAAVMQSHVNILSGYGYKMKEGYVFVQGVGSQLFVEGGNAAKHFTCGANGIPVQDTTLMFENAVNVYTDATPDSNGNVTIKFAISTVRAILQ